MMMGMVNVLAFAKMSSSNAKTVSHTDEELSLARETTEGLRDVITRKSLYAATLVGEEGKVICIEAHPGNFKALIRNIRLNGFRNMIALNVAAYNENGKSLQLSGSSDSEYSLKLSRGNSVMVGTRTVDSILKQYDIRNANWVKIDVEGAEAEVLEGMKRVIENSSDIKIMVEVRRESKRKVDKILTGFRNRKLGGDDPNIPVLLYSRN